MDASTASAKAISISETVRRMLELATVTTTVGHSNASGPGPDVAVSAAAASGSGSPLFGIPYHVDLRSVQSDFDLFFPNTDDDKGTPHFQHSAVSYIADLDRLQNACNGCDSVQETKPKPKRSRALQASISDTSTIAPTTVHGDGLDTNEVANDDSESGI